MEISLDFIENFAFEETLITFLLCVVVSVYTLIACELAFQNTPKPKVVARKEPDDAVDVFRFMDGSSFYILDDDDEYVFVLMDRTPIRIVSVDSVSTTPVTRSNPSGGISVYLTSVDGQGYRLTLHKLYDEFERDMCKEFIEQYL